MDERNIGRGATATADMKARIAALRRQGADVVDVLWERHRRAEVMGEGYRYEYAEETGPVRPGGDGGVQPGQPRHRRPSLRENAVTTSRIDELTLAEKASLT